MVIIIYFNKNTYHLFIIYLIVIRYSNILIKYTCILTYYTAERYTHSTILLFCFTCVKLYLEKIDEFLKNNARLQREIHN